MADRSIVTRRIPAAARWLFAGLILAMAVPGTARSAITLYSASLSVYWLLGPPGGWGTYALTPGPNSFRYSGVAPGGPDGATAADFTFSSTLTGNSVDWSLEGRQSSNSDLSDGTEIEWVMEVTFISDEELSFADGGSTGAIVDCNLCSREFFSTAYVTPYDGMSWLGFVTISGRASLRSEFVFPGPVPLASQSIGQSYRVNFFPSGGAVPEPASWLSMVIAFAIAGTTMRSRSRRPVQAALGA